jgi:hypothetical protein
VSDLLGETKDRLRQHFLGRGGIHGLGLSRAKRAIRVYISPASQASDRQAVLDELKKEAAPFAVVVVEEEKPHLTEGGKA